MVTDILLETALWASVPEERRQEWRLAIRELIDDHLFRVEQSPLLLRVSWDEQAVTLRFETVPGEVVAEVKLDRARLGQQMATYVDACKQLAALEANHASVVEIGVLDQAKRDAHDLAARDLLSDLDPVGPTHDTARRIFTLLVVLLVDTTKLSTLQRPHSSDVIARYHH